MLVMHLQASAIPAVDRAFDLARMQQANSSHSENSYASRITMQTTDTVSLFVDNWVVIDVDNLRAGGLVPEWFGLSVSESWCHDLQACNQTQCACINSPHNIIVPVGARNCCID